MNESESTKNEDTNTKLLTITKDKDGNFHSEPIKLDDGTQVEFFTERQDDQITKTQIFRELQFVEEELCETHNLTNHADTVDYAVSVGCGIICGIIDSVFVGEFDSIRGKELANDKINSLVIKVAQKNGCNCKDDDLESAIRYLEKHFGAPSDSVTDKFGGGKQHHLRDFAHHPTPVGLFFSLLTQFTEKAYGTNTKGSFIIEPIESKEFIGKDIPEKLFFGITGWILHMVSDMAGSSGTVAKGKTGTGLPGPLVSLLKELSSLPIFSKTNEDGNKEFSVWISKLFNGTLFAEYDEAGNIISESVKPFDLRAELGVGYEFGQQAIVVIINECFIRLFYFIRHLTIEIKQKNISTFEELKYIDPKKVLPFKNRTIVRMLTISKGTFEIFNVTDAAIRSKGFTNPSFLLHLNFAGAASFGLTAAVDIGMGIKKHCSIKAYGCPKNIKLIRLYQKNAGNLSELFKAVPELRNCTGPLFLHLDEKQYEKTPIKIMFVRVQHPLSLSYNEGMKQPKKLLSIFEAYKNYEFSSHDSFGNFAKKITASLNKDYSNQAVFIWNSVYKFSHTNKSERNAENESLRLLKDEIKICNPDAVIFMTGSKYDNDILKHFDNDDSFQKTCIDSGNKKLPDLSKKSFAKLIHKDKKLPEHMYRISDPHSLCFKLFKARSVQYWLEWLILGIKPKEAEKKSSHFSLPWKKILKILGIILLIILLLLVLRTCKGCTPDEKSRKDKVSVAAMQETKQPVSQPPAVTVENTETLPPPKAELKEMKSFTFRADRRDFVNSEEAEQWFDATAKEIKDLLQQRPNLKFKICGYVAEFDNEIDGMVLSQERADNIKKGLVKRGIPAEKLITILMGKTARWGKERKSNRVATIESFEE